MSKYQVWTLESGKWVEAETDPTLTRSELLETYEGKEGMAKFGCVKVRRK